MSEVNDNIMNLAHGAAHNFYLAVRISLKMHPSQRALFSAEGNIAFHHLSIKAALGEFSARPAAREESAFIIKPLRLYNECPAQISLGKNHSLT